MESFMQNIKQELKDTLRAYFIVPHLYEQGMACVEEKLRESMLFSRMTVLHYRAFWGTGNEIYRPAAAIELMILSLDIIDDLQDKDNKAMLWNQLSPEIALNIALGLLTLSQQMLMTSDFAPDRLVAAVRLMNEQVLSAINGQTTDLLNDISSEEDYIQMVKQKSAGLLVTACLIGTLLATGEYNSEVREYAEQLGIAAQIKNDIHDLVDWENKSDFWNRKKTLPTLYLIHSLTEEQKWISDYFEERLSLEEVVHRREEIQRIIEQSGTILYTSVRMRTHYYNYLDLVESMVISANWKKQILAMAD
ncbi:polyprenyl synthetase family protein [Paenibacillus agri]|uniref:Polyprenyl synthetase family protein n=1 Tax=Paenibacillus agri TaxID=2744309 RepID=A0A850ECZ7_9BACL|nr:polyprenyl synthetase family protein [Paenibacillus agri]NUU59123.1 polyprenyl synthetase family protein [Paenibacillus agri]